MSIKPHNFKHISNYWNSLTIVEWLIPQSKNSAIIIHKSPISYNVGAKPEMQAIVPPTSYLSIKQGILYANPLIYAWVNTQ